MQLINSELSTDPQLAGLTSKLLHNRATPQAPAQKPHLEEGLQMINFLHSGIVLALLPGICYLDPPQLQPMQGPAH